MLTVSFLVLLAIGELVIGSALLLESRRTKRMDQKLFAAIAYVFTLWTLTVGFLADVDSMGNASNIAHYRLINQAAFVTTTIILWLLLLFTQYYPLRRNFSDWTRCLIAVGVVLTVFSPSSLVAGSFSLDSAGVQYSYGKGIGAIVAYTLTVLGFMFFVGRKRIARSGDQKAKHQISVLLLSILLTVAHILAFVVILPAIFGQHPILYAIGYAGPYYLVALTAYGLLQLGLFDIKRIVVRTLGYLVTVLALSSLYGFVVFGLVKVIFDPHIPFTTQIFLSVATGIASLSFSGVKRFFDRATAHVFYQDAYDSEVLFDEFNKVLVSTIELTPLLQSTSRVIAEHIKSDFCLIGVKDGGRRGYHVTGTAGIPVKHEDIETVRRITVNIHKTVIATDEIADANHVLKNLLNKYNIALLVRLSSNVLSNQEGMGCIALGPKKSGNPYTSQDFKVIETLANELIIALQNALRFEEIERFNETLQEKIEVATKNLRRANHKLKKLNDTKDDFIGMASHQLRTPMTSAKGYISLVLDGDAGKITKQQRNLLDQAFFSTQRMVYLVADLLNVSRLKTGKFTIERGPTNLAKVITDELAQLKVSAAARNIELTYHPPARFPALPLDETKTRQVIMNFLDNAIYYTPSGGHVRVELVELPSSVEFTVVDDGIGVPAEDRPHLFTKFYRAKNAQRARPDGTGLGLYMAQKVVTAQGGAVIFRSREGQGSTFGFSFPKEMPEGMVPLPAHSRT